MIISRDKMKMLAKRLQSDINSGQKTVDEFREKLGENPGYALEWAHKVYRAVAQAQVAGYIKHILENSEDIDELITYVTREAIRGAKYPERSTSICSNLLERDLAAAWGEWAERLDELKRFGG